METKCHERTLCRICSGILEMVLNLGEQSLGGQFPLIGEPDPPKAPIRLCRCQSCGLAQLDYTVPPELMFRSYGYRSGVTQTMRRHLQELTQEAMSLVPLRAGAKVLDIGGNDGTLLNYLPMTVNKFIIDPADVAFGSEGTLTHCSGFFPQDMPSEWINFDLIFTIACFYDADDPVAFAKVIGERLAPDGIWCVEVADAARMAREGGWDSNCHEHLCYYEPATFQEVCRQARLTIIRQSTNNCNGGSIRFYVSRLKVEKKDYEPALPMGAWLRFAANVEQSKRDIAIFLNANKHQKVHLLGASTKANTWLQSIGDCSALIQAASERDSRKIGRKLPGTGIPIINEEESRAAKPDIYIVGPWHFEKEIVEREQEFLSRGGRLVFPLPRLHEVAK